MRLSPLPPAALRWSAAASAAAAISYADRGTSAIVASSLLDELHWTEGQLGEVQGAFFAGYALTQVLGGILGGSGGEGSGADDGGDGKAGGYRTVLPLSLALTGAATLLFPWAATAGGPSWASVDRFCLGMMEGVLLPAAMAGVSATTSKKTATTWKTANVATGEEGGDNIKATASAIVIAGCYLGSAWAYLSAWLLFSERFQRQMMDWGYTGSIWPWVFYVNGILSMGCLIFFQKEFDLLGNRQSTSTASEAAPLLSAQRIWTETLSIGSATIGSKSGRAIIAAQIGQGALLYSIASWGPLYLERVNAAPSDVQPTLDIVDASSKTAGGSSISPVAVTASIAASSLILPQITQALVGLSIGAGADRLSSKIGTRTTRRALQAISGVGPAIVLWYLAQAGNESGATALLSPAFLFGAAQTVSAMSLGAVSVSHLDIANPSAAGAVYALGNVAAAASGSLMVNLFGRLLEDGVGGGIDSIDASPDGLSVGSGGAEFALPFQVVAVLSAVGSLIYGCTVETEMEIGLKALLLKIML